MQQGREDAKEEEQSYEKDKEKSPVLGKIYIGREVKTVNPAFFAPSGFHLPE